MKNPRRCGFALISVLLIMILLTVMAFAMMSLSQTTTRSANTTSSLEEAKANARMALMIAIGELQQQVGPDQRITANASILSETAVPNPMWAGVWDSWIAGPLPSTVSGDYPSALSHQQTLAPATGAIDPESMHPNYAEKNKHFRRWMLSLNPAEATDLTTPTTLSLNGVLFPSEADDSVQLVGKGSTDSDLSDLYVSARLLPVMNDGAGSVTGRYAWWVGDESQKARVMADTYLSDVSSLTRAEKLFRSQAPGSMGNKTITGFNDITDELKFTTLATRDTLDLVTEEDNSPSKDNFHSATPYTYGVISDTREGGLKRDLSTILELPINIADTTDSHMLYRFDAAGQERVPIQDLAAFYQLYDQTRYASTSESWRKGVSYGSTRLPDKLHIVQPELGTSSAATEQARFLREYARMYKSVVPVKVQILVSMRAFEIPAASLPTAGGNTHYLRIYMMPAITLWNPTNLPLVMNLSNNNSFAQQMRFMSAGFNINWLKNGAELLPRRPLNLAYAATIGDPSNGRPGWGNAGGKKASVFDMYFGTTSNLVTFEPGEVRVFSYDPAHAGAAAANFRFLKDQRDNFLPAQQSANGWNPDVIFPMTNSIWGSEASNTFGPASGGRQLAFKATDQISIRISTDKDDGTDYSHDSEWPGAAFSYMMIQKNHQSRGTNLWNFRNYPALSRSYSQSILQSNYGVKVNTDFNDRLLKKGFPDPVVTIDRSASSIISASGANENTPLFQFALMAGVETSETSGVYSFSGRKFPSRPFLHSSPISPPHIDKDDNNSFYNYGMNWWIEEINSILEANIQVAPGNRSGYYGGGYSPLFGTTHVVQQEIPVTPPISIAALTHSHLGGFSLANSAPNLTNPVVSAVGVGGLYPFTLRAIANSYAHPLLAADKAFTTTERQFDGSTTPRTVSMVDHSYLANKSLWDEFFFSSIIPKNSAVKVFETASSASAKQLADDFFAYSKKLPNRRIIPYNDSFLQSKIDEIFTQQATYTNGLADKIASYLMVEGAFNVNSTSVSAWKVLLSSMAGKPMTYLNKTSVAYAESTPAGVTVSGLGLPLASPSTVSSTNPEDPQQWYGCRELTSDQINELALAIVKQVKLRGPFLSMSEFVNRRLDSTNKDLSVKGALQAALDDSSLETPVSINAGFRDDTRKFSTAEMATMTPAFPEALDGPVAYGSTAYVNQSDILRNYAEQLTTRGDTFIIRTYGEALDSNGNVTARAWCEAVVQRLPEYIENVDEAHVKQADLTSVTNQNFGRKLKIVSFKWLSPQEI